MPDTVPISRGLLQQVRSLLADITRAQPDFTREAGSVYYGQLRVAHFRPGPGDKPLLLAGPLAAAPCLTERRRPRPGREPPPVAGQ